MARVEVWRDPETGEMVGYLPGVQDPIPIDENDLATLRESGPEAFLRSANNAIEQAGTGARALGAGLIGAEETEAEALGKLRGLRERQELRGAERPVTGFAGSVVPDVALGAITGGLGTAARRVAATGAVEGALGAARNPEAPLAGAALQGGLGVAAMGIGPAAGLARRAVHPVTERMAGGVRRVIGRTAAEEGSEAAASRGLYRTAEGETGMEAARSPLGAGARAAGADVTANPNQTQAAGRIRRGPTAAEMVDRWQTPLTANQAAMRDADDAAVFQSARRAHAEEELQARTGSVLSRLWNGEPTDFGALREAQTTSMTRNIMSEIGMPQAQKVDRQLIGDNLTRISEDISGIIKQSGRVRSGPIIKAWQGLLDDYDEGPAGIYLRRLVKQAQQKSGNAATMSAEDAAQLRNRLGDIMERMGKNEPDLEGVQVMGTARDALDDELKRHWTPDMQEQFEELGYQWKLSLALVRGARGAVNDMGDVNMASFMNNWRMLDDSVRTGRRRGNEFLDYMEAMGEVLHKDTPDSGTPAGIAARVGQLARDSALGMVPGGNVIGNILR